MVAYDLAAKAIEDICDSPSFQMSTEILKPEQIDNYARTCPELFDQQRKLFDISNIYPSMVA